jgi:hypothetical protein
MTQVGLEFARTSIEMARNNIKAISAYIVQTAEGMEEAATVADSMPQ